MKKSALLCALLLLAACPKKQEVAAPPATPPTPTASADALPPNHPPISTSADSGATFDAAHSGATFDAAHSGAPMDAVHNGALTKASNEPISGTVVETLDSGGFTYIRFSTAKGDRWAAVGQAELPVGAKITIAPSTIADRFASQPLKRTFDNLIFGALTSVESSEEMPAPMTSRPAAAKVTKAEGEHARTIAEVWANQATIKDGEPIVVRGTVTRVLRGIMDRNWIHLRDGSGKEDEITVTSKDSPSVGSVVTATGKLYRNKDFGSGYKYAVLVEEAKVQ
ncbi:MAG: DNA-binding protein [Acidobacteria bacterium]|nr:DNA-binding protein [Acidobacteriota bacterium]